MFVLRIIPSRDEPMAYYQQPSSGRDCVEKLLGDEPASPMNKFSKDYGKTTLTTNLSISAQEEAPEFETESPDVWPDTDEEWNDKYYYQLCEHLPGCETQLSVTQVPNQDCQSLPITHLAMMPQGKSGVSEIPIAPLIGKDALSTPLSQSTTLDISNPSIASSDESLPETEKVKKPGAKSKISQPSKLEKAKKTAALARQRALALMPFLETERPWVARQRHPRHPRRGRDD